MGRAMRRIRTGWIGGAVLILLVLPANARAADEAPPDDRPTTDPDEGPASQESGTKPESESKDDGQPDAEEKSESDAKGKGESKAEGKAKAEPEGKAKAEPKGKAKAKSKGKEMPEGMVMDDDDDDMDMSSGGGHHAMAHPFFAHMGLPDGPGEANVRLTGMGRFGHDKLGPDAAFHIEAGLVQRVGIHVRSDAIWNTAMDGSHDAKSADEKEKGGGEGTEAMVMVSVLQSEDATRGLSIFAQLGWPSFVEIGDDPITGAFGISGRYMASNRFLMDANVHLAPSAEEVGVAYEVEFMVRPFGELFAIIENRGHYENLKFSTFLLPALKYRFGTTALGMGVQFPLTSNAPYDAQAMLQLDVGFM